ncbi:probable serine/threonine-protein kinase At1g54610 [Durio zibethinus]|uniref:Probable serine/threonine-protein kinase At1g54610 n=1 Tax=Durio zibethinus TaxID=66656 RepID=A0A6P6B5C6_DURZI|nr:probable serine/threonine-protein kinase At1g54610 [Durio zibethinus]
MGCVHGKNSMNSPPRGLEKLKMENGYMGKERFVGHRRSTGQRYSEPGRFSKPEPPKKLNGFGSADGVVAAVAGGKEGNFNGKEKMRSNEAVEKRNFFVVGDEMVDGWPKWLIDNIPKEVLAGLVPKSAELYDKIDKIGQGTYSNVYKARDRETGKIVALKKVRFDTSEPESVKFMAREIMILQKLDHPNIVKLEGLATSRMQYSLYLVFDFMHSDLARIITRPEGRLTEPQIKYYMHQLLSGLQHCHERGILHRDIKGSNLLIDKNGILKIADFGLANFFSPNRKYPLTNRVVTLWYRAPELLLGSTDYGVGIDLWSAGCLLAEMFAGGPIMPGRTEVEQLHKIFKLCGTPSEGYWKKLRLSTAFRPPQSDKPSLIDAFRNFPKSSLGLLSTLLALDPAYRGTASSALKNEFFYTSPLACDLSGLPLVYNKDDEANQPRQHRNSKMKRRSQTLGAHRKQDEVAEQKEEAMFHREGTKKSTESKMQVEEPGSSTMATSTSSGSKPTQVESPPLLLSLVASSGQKTSPSTHVHSSASRNITNRPPLPGSQTRAPNYQKDKGNMYRLNQVGRSASTREFRTLNQRKHLEYAIDDYAM